MVNTPASTVLTNVFDHHFSDRLGSTMGKKRSLRHLRIANPPVLDNAKSTGGMALA